MRLVLRLVLYLIFPLLFALVIFCGVRYFIHPLTLASSSMIPNLKKGEHLVIERFSLMPNPQLARFTVVAMVPPYVDGKIFPPAKYDKISHFIGNLTGFPGMQRYPVCIRRIIGLPGEKIKIDPELGILIDGKQIDENAYISAKQDYDGQENTTSTNNSNNSNKLLDQAEVVPSDSYFVLPDNRRDFGGSEAWGFVEKKRLIGVVSYRLKENSIKKLPDPSVSFSDPKITFNDEGVKALHQSKFKEAITFFLKSLALDPEYAVARENLSIAYSNYAFNLHKDPELAISMLHKSLYIDPENELTKKNLDCLLQIMGKDPQKAIERAEIGNRFLAEGKDLDAYVEFCQAKLLGAESDTIKDLNRLEHENFTLDEICRSDTQ